MKNTFCYLCLAANRRTLNIYKTDLQYVYESLAQYKIRDSECWMCYICHTRLQQCLRLQQLAVQTRGLIDGCQNKINIGLRVLGSLLELSIYRTKNISIPYSTSCDTQEPNTKNQLDLKLESTNDIAIDPNVESLCDYEEYKQLLIEYDDPLMINDIDCEKELPIDRNASSNEVQLEVQSQVTDKYVQHMPTIHTIKEEYLEGLESQNTTARCSEQRSVEEMQQHIQVEIEYLGNEQDANDQERDHLMEAQTNSKRKPHHCEMCSKTFTCRSLLLQHARKHTGEKPFRCHICQKEFTRNVNLKTHIETHSGLNFSCHICPKKFAAKFNLSKHVKTHEFQKAFTCEICHNKFSRKGYLKVHQVIHTGDKPYNCDICSRSFSQKKTLKYHILSHMNVKPYTCNICHRKFAQRGDLNRHIRVHTGERPHGCQICHKKFAHKSNLKKHTLIHSNIKPFNCAIVDVVSIGAEVQQPQT